MRGVVVALCACLLTVASPSLGQPGGCEGEFAVALTDWGAWDFAYADDGDGVYTAEDLLHIVSAGSTSLHVGAVRLLDGTTVAAGDADEDTPLRLLPGTFAFQDASFDRHPNPDETRYWDVDEDGYVSAGDVLLDAHHFGQDIHAQGHYQGDVRVGQELTQMEASLAVDARGMMLLVPASVRSDIGAVGQTQMLGVNKGAVIGMGHWMAMAVIDVPLEWALYFVDEDADQAPGDKEPLYLGPDGDAFSFVGRHAIRLANVDGHSMGSQVSSGHWDYGNPTTRMSGALAFGLDDVEGVIFWDTDGSDDVSVGDFVLSHASAGTRVDERFGSARLGDAVVAFSAARFGAWDRDASGGLSAADSIWLDVDGNGRVSAYDVSYTPILGDQLDVHDDLVKRNGQAGAFSAECTGDAYPGTYTAIAGPDRDGDRVSDAEDNCPMTANAGQADLDGDGVGDACDDDDDGDGAPDATDNCPRTANPDQQDGDGNRIGDACDRDGDGIRDAADAYPDDPQRASGHDMDGDGIDDEFDEDIDGDGFHDEDDNCPRVANAGQHDRDDDGVGDACDEVVSGEDEAAAGAEVEGDGVKVGTGPAADVASTDADRDAEQGAASAEPFHEADRTGTEVPTPGLGIGVLLLGLLMLARRR